MGDWMDILKQLDFSSISFEVFMLLLAWYRFAILFLSLCLSIFVYGSASAPHTHAPKGFKEIGKTKGA